MKINDEYLKINDICHEFWMRNPQLYSNNQDLYTKYFNILQNGADTNLKGDAWYQHLKDRTVELKELHKNIIPEFKQEMRNRKLKQLLG